MVIANLVHRDFENEIRQFGDVVNTRRPGTFQIRRKADGIALSNQDAQATNVQVPLNQWFYNSFTILDGEASQSFQDLVDIYLRPGMITIARSVDRAVLGQVHQFLNGGVNGVPTYVGNPYARVGRLGNLSAANSKDYVLEARQTLNINKAPLEGRNLVLAPVSETALLKNELFIAAQQRGDFGTALESATLGRILGFDTYMDQNVNSASPTDVVAGTVTSAVASGVTQKTANGNDGVTLSAYTVNVGEFAVVAGNDQPTWVTAATTASGATTAIDLNEPNKYATAAGAAVAIYKACQIGATYSAGYVAGIILVKNAGDTGFVAPAVGQLLSFGTTPSARVNYTVIESYLDPSNGNAVTVILDRPLVGGLTSGQLAFPGPAGALNLAFHRNAIALVTRPLAIPNNAMGVLSHVGVYNDIAMRVSMQYSIANGGTVVNLDILAGVAVLDTNLAVVLQG